MTTRRYLFLFYNQLEAQQIELLAQVSDKIYLFVSEEVSNVPLTLAIKLQKLGKSLKWVVMETDGVEDRRMHLAFHLGKLHEKLPTDIEFAVFSNDEDYDAIIAHLNRARRRCQRVRTDSDLTSQITPDSILDNVLFNNERPPAYQNISSVPEFKEEPTLLQSTEVVVMNLAARVRERMLHSGNRPAELDLLKEYIITNTPDIQPAAAEKVISHMANSREIEIENREVLYHF